MTELPSQIDWYLARDGQQHGPLSENEMRAFVDLGHLRPDDLIWRAGFADWRPAPEVFALHAMPAPPQSATPTFEPAFESFAPSATLSPSSIGPATAIAAEWHAPAQPVVEAQREPQLTSPDQLIAAMVANAGVTSTGEQPVNRHRVPAEPLAAPEGDPVRGPSPAVPAAGRPIVKQPHVQAAQPIRDQRIASYADTNDDDIDDAAPRRRLGAGRIAAALVFALLIGGAMAAILKRDLLTGMLPVTLASAGLSSSAAPLVPAGATAEGVDQSFQRSEIWRHIKQEFPEWYTERVQEAAKFATEKRGEAAISKHLTEALVTLRRKHADQALAASPERLRFVATAFLDNLQALSKNNVATCYGFISQGETFPAILEMMQKPDSSANLHKQLIAVFEAIADGRKAPQNYLSPRKADYDALASELNARGWTENDLRTFSDPRALGRATPEQVCKMVQDWFAAQIAIKDQDTQLRLLVESLRPVVAG